ncbi:MAG: hypothetical protein K8H74_18070 [Notoacmeibacter sp.]|nr:hypothetical protein [Notoacmeibacter sp.]
MRPTLERISYTTDAATRLVIFIVGCGVASWLLFNALDALIAWAAA